ncbi:MAG: general secretion pathway protein GspB [Firmicutes bacterium]|nr:general secretion pathway protein GspB [Bacillota bacterium]
MRKAVAYLRTHPLVAGALAIALVVVAVTVWPRQGPPPTPATSPPRPAVSPQAAAPTPEASPQPQPAPSPTPSPTPAALPGAGRLDPFAPLVVAEAPRPASGPVPPPAPLPPPLFPGQQVPGQPAPAPMPTPPPKEASTAELVGLVNDSVSVAIVRVGGQTYIVSPGDVIKDKIRVTAIDPEQRLVVLEEDGQRFELRMGEVRARHVAATTALGRN